MDFWGRVDLWFAFFFVVGYVGSSFLFSHCMMAPTTRQNLRSARRLRHVFSVCLETSSLSSAQFGVARYLSGASFIVCCVLIEGESRPREARAEDSSMYTHICS